MVDQGAGVPIWIGTNDQLAEAVRSFGSVVAVDTEFIRTDTYFPIASLYQIATPERIFLIDPLTVDDWLPLQAVIEDPHCVKVMHSCSEDLEVFYSHLGLVPQSLYDSQLAHAFLTTDYSLSYARLVAHYQNIELEKGETRSNWLQRPLSERQIHYAAEDVRYLIAIYEQQQEALQACGRLDWFYEDLAVQCRYNAPYPERYFLTMKTAWRLDPTSLERLRALATWREQEAMALNQPRNRIVRDEQLLTLAARATLQAGDLQALLPAHLVRRFGSALLAAWNLQSAPLEPLMLPDSPLTTAQSKLVERLRGLAKAQAEALGVAPELVGRKRDVEAALRAHISGQGLARFGEGWRSAQLGPAFQELLATAL